MARLLSAADIRVFLATELPLYEDSDSEDSVFIVSHEDVTRVSLRLQKLIYGGDAKKTKENI